MRYVTACELRESLWSGSLLVNVKLFSLIRGKGHSVNRGTVRVVRKFAGRVCVDGFENVEFDATDIL